MAYNYDKLYGSTPHALGEPTPIFVEFFEALTAPSLRVLDVGCGQGRDAIFIARLGHQVVALDLSKNGIQQLNDQARRENHKIEGITADIRTFTTKDMFDVVLIDRTLHMLDPADRLTTLNRILGYVAPCGQILIADEPANIPDFKAIFAARLEMWQPTLEKSGYLFAQRL